jgi:hypothetical protein
LLFAILLSCPLGLDSQWQEFFFWVAEIRKMTKVPWFVEKSIAALHQVAGLTRLCDLDTN